jgi:excisionase family DNA binding protein
MLANEEVAGRRADNASPRGAPENLKPRARRINDACVILQISRSHLYALAAKGKIRLARIGGRTVVPESEIERLLGEAA